MTEDLSHPDPPSADQHGSAPPSAPEELHRYSTAEIAVEWRPARCIHSAICVHALPLVFDPKRRPWIEAERASADAIAAAVYRCPSGALRCVRHDGARQEAPDAPVTLTPIRNGPLYVRGDVDILDLQGDVVRHESRMALCRCGRAAHMPFCDNTCHASKWAEPGWPLPARDSTSSSPSSTS